MRCRSCELFYVVLQEGQGEDRNSSDLTAAEMVRLAGRASELALVEPQVELNERPWRELMATERLNDLKRFVTRGRFLEIGSSTGEMLASAALSFEATGVEADVNLYRIAHARGLDCFNGTLVDAAFPEHHFDVVALYHVIEHFRSPRAEVREMHRILKPGGLLVIETPNIATVWFHLLGARQYHRFERIRQFIDVENLDAAQMRHLVEVEIVGHDRSIELFPQFDQLQVHLSHLREIRLVDLDDEPVILLDALEDVQSSAPAIAFRGIR